MLRQRLADTFIGLRVMRMNALRSMSSLEKAAMTPLTSVHKLYWATLHRALGELAVDVLGPDATIADGSPYELSAAQRLFLYSPRRHDLRRVQPDPAQHHRRAGPGPAP